MLINIITLAFRNLGRHKVKTIITSTSIVLCVFSYIIMDAWMKGIAEDSKRNIISLETGAAKIYSKNYLSDKDNMPMYEGFRNWENIISELNKNGYNATPKMTFAGTLLYNNKELPFVFNGLDPNTVNDVFEYARYIEQGDFITDQSNTLIIGAKGAHDLGVTIGDTVKLSTTIDQKTETGRIVRTTQVMELKIGGIINTNNPYINGRVGFMNLGMLNDEIMGLRLSGMITEISIRKSGVPSGVLTVQEESPEIITRAIQNVLPDNLIVVSWTEDAKDFIAMSTGDRAGTALILFFLVVLTVIGISNTMLMATLERTKEIGMIRALGMSDRDLFWAYFIEASIIGFIGSSIGFILSIPANLYMINIGVDLTAKMSAFGNDELGYRVIGIFRAVWNWNNAIACVIIATAVAGIASIMPVIRALKITIVEALRFE